MITAERVLSWIASIEAIRPRVLQSDQDMTLKPLLADMRAALEIAPVELKVKRDARDDTAP